MEHPDYGMARLITFGRKARKPLLAKVGGLWFWRIGRLGGSIYLAREH